MKKEFRSFEDAKKFVASLNLESQKEWTEYCKSGNKPDDIPAKPQNTYKNKGWISLGEFLGTGRIADQNKQFRPYSDAKKFVASLNLESQKEWTEYCKSGNKPDDIPAKPQNTYKNKGWISLGEFLGTGRIADQNKQFRPYSDAKKFVASLNLESYKEWTEYRKSGNKPENIPASPVSSYKKEWTSWMDFLGTDTPSSRNRKYITFEEAKKFVQTLNLESGKEWIAYCKSGNKPNDIPSNPNQKYKNKGWISMGDWLGTGRTKNFRSFKEAKKFVQTLNLESIEAWKEYCKSGDKPLDIPVAPHSTYKNKGWTTWGYFLGNGNIATQVQHLQWASFKDAKKVIHELAQKYNLKNYNDWQDFAKSGKLPKNIPTNPSKIYSKKRKK